MRFKLVFFALYFFLSKRTNPNRSLNSSKYNPHEIIGVAKYYISIDSLNKYWKLETSFDSLAGKY